MKVSVCIITYNQELFLAQALESVLAQKTSFEFEVVVGEDGSTDRTRDILLEFQRKYPRVIKPVWHRRNVGISRNLADVLQHASGEYIAILEGDDFWTDPEKLQLQSDFLDAHPELSMCFHKGISVGVDDPSADFALPPVPEQSTYTLRDLLTRKNFMFTHSTMLRGRYFRTLPRLCWQMNAIDFSLYVLSALNGDIGYIPRNMCQHRRHKGSYWFGTAMKSGLLVIQIRTAKDFENIDRYFRHRYATQIRTAAYYFELANSAYSAGNLTATHTCLHGVLRSIQYDPQLDREAVKDLMDRAGMFRTSSLLDRARLVRAKRVLADR